MAVLTEDEIGSTAKAFNYMAERLEAIEENRKSFISAVAHELRSPLTLIRGFIQGIVDGTVALEDQNKYLHIILKETERLNKLIANLLDIQRMESDAYPFYPQSFDMNELIRRTLIKYEEEIDKKSVRVHLKLLDQKVFVWADRDAMEQVLNNLLENAMKFMDIEGKLEVDVKIQENKAIVQIKDQGMGISEEEQKYIWDRFYKVDKSRDRKQSGTGLGLYIVKKIIDRHGEEIWIESIVGEGTAFNFSIALDEK